MYKIGIIGDKDSVLGFMAVGFSVYVEDDPDSARALLKRLVRGDEGEYAIIYITERLELSISEDIAQYRSRPTPAIISIPGKDGSSGYGVESIKKSVEKAVGADILFKK